VANSSLNALKANHPAASEDGAGGAVEKPEKLVDEGLRRDEFSGRDQIKESVADYASHNGAFLSQVGEVRSAGAAWLGG
jgi:hypothetical protein